MKQLFKRSAWAAAIVIAAASGAMAQSVILIGGTPNAEPATAMVAEAEGIFKKHGIDGQFKLIPINPTIPPALLSNSLQIGLPTPTTYLQAVDSGLDLVVIAGVSVSAKNATGVSIVVRKDSAIKSAKDLEGKRFGVPGLNAVLHVMTRRWLMESGVDPKKVNFVEAMFPTQGDLLKAGQIDAVVTVDPFLARIKGSGDGVELVNLISTLPDGRPTMMYVTTRDWATKNAAAVKAFRAAIDEAAKFIADNPDKAREDIGKALNLPAPAIKNLALPAIDTKVRKEQLDWWVDVMNKQEMLRTKIDTAKLILQ